MLGGYATFSKTSLEAQIAALTTRVDALEANQLLTITKSLTSAQILNSATTPITIIPAPGANNYLQVFSVYARSNFGTIPYATNLNGRLRIGNANMTLFNYPANTLMGQSVTVEYQDPISALIASTQQSPPNTALVFSTGVGNPTAGNGTIDFYISYKIITF